jgi:Protein of unknown function (DUF1257).
MSVCIVSVVLVPSGINLLGGVMLAAATAAANAMNLKLEVSDKSKTENENSVDLCLNNASEVTDGIPVGKHLNFSGDGVKVIFFQNADGDSMVRVSGHKSKAELSALGDTLSKKIVQQYAYHRLVTEMKARNMNVIEEEVEEDGTVRLRVRTIKN